MAPFRATACACNVAAGSRLGPYEVVAPLGSGGMGEVYRARDTKWRVLGPSATGSEGSRPNRTGGVEITRHPSGVIATEVLHRLVVHLGADDDFLVHVPEIHRVDAEGDIGLLGAILDAVLHASRAAA